MIQITRVPGGRFLTAAGSGLLDFIFPPHCLLCGGPLPSGPASLCRECRESLEEIRYPFCPRCGCPGEARGRRCANCSDKPFRFSRMRVLAPFHPPVQRLVHMLKYQSRTAVGPVLGRALGEVLAGDGIAGAVSVILPVPLHGSRRRERGYNQSALIARAVGKQIGVRVSGRVLRRVRATETQTALDLSGRAANVQGAFRVRGSAVRGVSVLLIDDVITTGATMNACTEALLEAGAKQVFAAAAACPYFEAGESARLRAPDTHS